MACELTNLIQVLKKLNFCFCSFSSFMIDVRTCQDTRHFDTLDCPHGIFWWRFANSPKLEKTIFVKETWLHFMQNSTRISQGTGGANCKGGRAYYFGNFQQKLRELEQIRSPFGSALLKQVRIQQSYNNHWKVNIQAQ